MPVDTLVGVLVGMDTAFIVGTSVDKDTPVGVVGRADDTGTLVETGTLVGMGTLGTLVGMGALVGVGTLVGMGALV